MVFQRLTAKCWLAVTVTTDGSGSCGNVLAVMWQMGEFDRNFMIMQTSSGTGENIMGDKCMAELRGGWGSIRSWDGVWPKFRIWFSTASRITTSWIDSRSTLPSYVR